MTRETFSLCVIAVSFTQAVALETETFSVCLKAVPITQEVAPEIYDRIISHCLIALTFPQSDTVEILDQRLSHCDLSQCHLFRRSLGSFMTRDSLTVPYGIGIF